MGFRVLPLPIDIVRDGLRSSLYSPAPLPNDPFVREEVWIASGDGATFAEFVSGTLAGEARRTLPPDAGIYCYR